MPKYEFKTQPYAHQRKALTHRNAWHSKAFAWFMDMGTGKTKVTLDNVGILCHEGSIDGLLIVAPKTVCSNWAEKEIPKHLPTPYFHMTWKAPSTQTRAWKHGWQLLLSVQKLAILVMNVEALSSKKGRQAAEEFLHARRVMMVIDESTRIKNHRSARGKNCIALGKLATHRRILSGFPVTRDPLDLWGQAEFLEHGILGDTSYWSFRARWAILHRRRLASGLMFDEITGYRNLEDLAKIVDTWSFRVTKEECLDLPPKVYQTREVELTPEQKKAYAELRDELMTVVGDVEVDAASVLEKLIRMQQVINGWLPGHVLPSNRVSALMETLEETDGAVVWCKFVNDVALVSTAIQKKYGKDSVCELHGNISADRRTRVIGEFQDPMHERRFVVGTPDTGGVGIDLTAANTCVYFSNSWNLEHRVQSEDRLHRIGQTRSVTYVDLIAPGTLDETILDALECKQDLAKEVIRMSPGELMEMT